MSYCLIGKIVVWGVGIVLLALLSYALLMSYDGLTHRWRVRLLGSPPREFLIESIFTGMCEAIANALDLIGLRRLNAWTQDVVMRVLVVTILTLFIPLAFLELGLRYTWKRAHNTTAPSALA